MIDIKIRVKVTGALQMIDRLGRIDVKKTFDRIKPSAKHDQDQHDRALQGPDGPWPSYAASTLARRARKRGRDKRGRQRSWPAKMLGRFPKSIQAISSSRSLIVRSRIAKFSLVHQEGGRAGHGANIPRRQFLWISAWLRERTRVEFQRALDRAAAGEAY